MKDLLTQKEALIPLCLAESPELSLDIALDIDFKLAESGTLNVRRSAAMLGLAISMGAASMLFSQHRATAANSVLHRPTLSTVTIPLGTPQNLAPNSPVIRLREVPLLKSELKSGESLPQLTEAYPQNSPAILSANSANNVSAPEKDSDKLLPSGQSATAIPLAIATQPIATQPTPLQSAPEFDPSLDRLQSTRQRLQAELADLQSEQAKATTDGTDEIGAQIQSNDVSQPLQEADPLPTALETPSRLYASREPSPVPQTTTLAAATILENGFNQPIPIPVPTPESAIPQAVPLRRIAAPQPFEADPASSNRIPDGIPQKSTSSRLNPSDQSSPSLAAFNQPIPLPVPTPASQINLATPMSPPELPLASPQAIPIQSDDNSVSSSSAQTYQVRPGDTLNSIARRHGLTIEQLIRANQITQPNVITVSQSLVIPPHSTASRRDPSQSSSQNSSLSPLRLPVAVSPSADALPSATTHNPTEVVENTPQPISISEASLDQSYTEKLKADVSHLESTSGHPISGIAIPVTQPPAPESISALSDGGDELVDSEWQSDRKTLAHRNRSPELPPLSRPASALTEGQLIGAAPINVQEYNNNLRIPVGQEVSPELPPLSGPDHYLPDAPMQSAGYIWPAKGVLTSGYGWRWGRMHKGIDIAAPIGTPVLAAAPGEVISAGWNSGGYGNLVKILHADGSITLYAHNSRILVRKGQQVAQGEQISAMGSTGFSTGPHLHFEVHPGGKSAVNPIAYLPSKGKNL